MADPTTHALRRFTQKMAGQTKQANPLAFLSDPRFLYGAGGALAGGLGVHGLMSLLRSEDDEPGYASWLLPALGAAAGGAGGAYGGPQLAAMLAEKFKKKPTEAPKAAPGLSANDAQYQFGNQVETGPGTLPAGGATPTA